ncbi:MAG: acetyl-CoA carboxylase biotin carboxylase subunit [Candidatus Goldbacteria bacterium]|nr:acetyl-CoA carboxylase biotin carboxylase subunit [Candidatus Goldiibacteriota bacterium]
MFKRILIANRGEIALRIIRACKEMGIETVAVFSEADENSLHVRYADHAICIGPSSPKESYLNIPAIISAAEVTDSEAIHPGYGFLAENAHFAEVCRDCNIKFIGPSPDAITLMGNKAQAIITAKSVGVPTVPGSGRVLKDENDAVEIAKKIGYPVILKASAGGGGRGMRVAHTEISLRNSFKTARQEAQTAFGDPSIYLEKYIEEPRHIEVQIIADAYGNCVALGERDCTIQRRHQKLIEEAPSPMVNEKLRHELCSMAIKIAKAVKYENTGTIEFIMDKYKRFYFMEMNTRIQVEHPVTEEVIGIDLIKEQIKVAAGEKLALPQKELKLRGHAIECRINAEDPDNNFIPSPGLITEYNTPGGHGIRIDTHVYKGYKIPPYYDSMVAKIIAHGKDRMEAIAKMKRALDEFVIEGIKTTIPLHKKILNNENFILNNYSTHFIEKMENKG